MNDTPITSRRAWRPRFGLRALFVLVTVIALLIAAWRVSSAMVVVAIYFVAIAAALACGETSTVGKASIENDDV